MTGLKWTNFAKKSNGRISANGIGGDIGLANSGMTEQAPKALN
jgi:hypothetical protein